MNELNYYYTYYSNLKKLQVGSVFYIGKTNYWGYMVYLSLMGRKPIVNRDLIAGFRVKSLKK